MTRLCQPIWGGIGTGFQRFHSLFLPKEREPHVATTPQGRRRKGLPALSRDVVDGNLRSSALRAGAAWSSIKQAHGVRLQSRDDRRGAESPIACRAAGEQGDPTGWRGA